MRLLRRPPLPATPRAWLVHGRHTGVAPWLLALALLLALLLGAGPAGAATYDFPSAMPQGCSGSNGSYRCSITSLGYADVVTISGTKPATITFTGALTLDAAKINQGGTAGDLNLVVQGVLNPGYATVIQAHVQAGEFRDGNGQVSIGGNLRTTSGPVALGYRTTIAGNVTSDAGDVALADEAVVRGNITGNVGVRTTYKAQVGGSILAGDGVSVGQEARVGGSITAGADVLVDYAAQVTGDVTSNAGSVGIAQATVLGGCARAATAGTAITLGYQSNVAAVCCGTLGSCSNTCVTNNSTYAMPAACSAPPPAGLYLTGDGVPVGSLTTTAPTGPLRNIDPGRDSALGLLLKKGGKNVSETDSNKIQRWITSNTTISSNGVVELRLWTAMKDFRTDKAGGLTAYLRVCNATRSSCANVASSSITRSPWHNSTTWVERTLSFGNLSGTLGSNNVLELSVIVNDNSDDDMLLAYDSASHPSRLTNATAAPAPSGPARLRIEHASGSGLTCTPSTLTVRACASADCSSNYTGGAVSGTLSSTGGSVTWPDGASFSIAAGSSTATVRVQATTTTATVLGVASNSPAAGNAATCNFGSPVCTFTAADAGFVFNVPDHVSEVAQTISVSAVRKSGSSTACTPAFASTSKAVTFSCGYTNPATGTLPVRVGGSALNSGNNAAAACDGIGRSVSLAFNASGVATTTVLYADAGQVTLNASYTGSAGTSDSGLAMTGSDAFIAAPDHFAISGVTTGPIRAGANFAATVAARNAAGNTTPNHGREASAQQAAIGWVKLQPTGSGAVAGSFSGTGVRSFASGTVTASDLAWTEVGRGDLVVRGSDSTGYLGSGLQVFGSSLATGARTCAVEGGSCVLPVGTTATVYYGAPGGWAVKAAQTGTVACNNSNFGDPLVGTAKRCYYAVSSASNGSVGDFIPNRFSVAAPNACGPFTYAGQPATATVTAVNTAGNTTLNFNGTATTAPTFAQAVTLSDANAMTVGALSGGSIAATAFSAGVASASVSYAFHSKTTGPQSLLLRASNDASGSALVSSQGGTEATLALRSGRLRLSNAYGKAAAALQVSAVSEYWAGNAWLLNGADSCTAVAGASVALSNRRSATGAASAATTSAGALTISNGSGSITLAAPSPAGSSLSLDLAVNLGSTATDQSCHGAHPATTGAGKPWLRSQIGSCASTADRDPAARASFGISSPETRKTVHVRELF